jgi:hypothetical protein
MSNAARYRHRERAFYKQSSSKIICDKTQRSAINVFQQPLKCDNEEIDCDVAELDQKTKLLYMLFFNHPLYCYLNFVNFMPNVVYCVLVTYHAVVIA